MKMFIAGIVVTIVVMLVAGAYSPSAERTEFGFALPGGRAILRDSNSELWVLDRKTNTAQPLTYAYGDYSYQLKVK
jgi:hypothetical protein